MAEFQEVMKQRTRLCNRFSKACIECPLYRANSGADVSCDKLTTANPAKYETIVMNWAKEHPEPKPKTMLEVVLERFPKIRIEESGIPSGICPDDLYGKIAKHDCNMYSEVERSFLDCRSCWNRPAPEEYQDKEAKIE